MRLRILAAAIAAALAWPAVVPAPASADQTQNLAAPIGTVTITALHSGQCIDVIDASKENGARIRQWACNGSIEQRWDLIPASGGTYHLRNRNSGRCLDVYNVGQSDGTPLQQWDCNSASQQQFTVPLSGREGQMTVFGKCLEITDGSYSYGATLQLWSCLGHDNQKFRLNLRSVPPIPGTTLRDTAHGRCVTAPNGNNNTRATSAACDPSDSGQYWYIEPTGAHYQIRNVEYPNICLTIPHWANYDAALYACGGHADQLYNRVDSGGNFQYKVAASGYCLVNAHWDPSFLSSYNCGSYPDMWYREQPQ